MAAAHRRVVRVACVLLGRHPVAHEERHTSPLEQDRRQRVLVTVGKRLLVQRGEAISRVVELADHAAGAHGPVGTAEDLRPRGD
jgi:hypothetical protein